MSEKTSTKPPSLDDIAPYPTSVEDVTAEGLAAHFAAFAQLNFRIGHDDPDRRDAEESSRAFVSFYAITFLLREIHAAGIGVADRVAKSLWEAMESPHMLGPDVWGWLEEDGIDPERINEIAARLIASKPVPSSAALPLGEGA